MRAWELKHRALTSQCVAEHTLFRKETRWPGYYYRGDHLKLDDENWHVLTVSRRDPKTGKFTMEKVPVYHIIDEENKKIIGIISIGDLLKITIKDQKELINQLQKFITT